MTLGVAQPRELVEQHQDRDRVAPALRALAGVEVDQLLQEQIVEGRDAGQVVGR